jgi:hypothetical protein
MELDILKHFIRMDVEVFLKNGTMLEGTLLPIRKALVVLSPLPEMSNYYGPSTFKAEDIIAIRQIKRTSTPIVDLNPPVQEPIRSSLEQVSAKNRFK